MTGKKLRNILYGLIAFGLVVFIVISYFGMSILKKQSQSMVDRKAKSLSLEAQRKNLTAAKRDVEKYSSFNDVAATVIPRDKKQVQAIADIVQMANQSGILLQGIAFPNSTLGAKPSTATQPGSTSTATGSSTQLAISQAKPFSGIPGLYSLEVTITPNVDDNLPPTSKVTFPKLVNFLSAIENNRRTAQVTQISITPIDDKSGPTGEYINFNLILNIFIKP